MMTGCKEPIPPHPGPIYKKIYPGSSEIDVSKLQPERIHYSKFRGSMIYNLEKLDQSDEPLFRLFIDFKVNGRNAPDSVYFSTKDLSFKKRWFHNAFANYTGQLSMEDKTLRGQIIPEEESSLTDKLVFNKTFKHKVFEPAILHYVLSCLPLELGYRASLPMLDLNDGSSVIWANIEVVEETTTKVAGKRRKVWKIISHGSRYKTFWLLADEPVFVKMKNQGVKFKWRYKSGLD